MKRTDSKENPNTFYVGKGLVIIVILVISSISFTLGYFVGKSVHPPIVNQSSFIHENQDRTEQKNIPAEDKNASIQHPEPITETQKTIETKEASSTKESKEIKTTKEIQKISKSRKYTVQVGAFKNVSDANALKAKLDKKGYKTVITQAETKKHKNFYKVMIGNFITRKEAEVLSVKIKKSEGLNTFVTFKSE
jgi:cell division septation protein DedD